MSRRYFGIGWRRCLTCGQMGYAYKMDNHFEVKHPADIADSQQMTFADSSLQMQPKSKQKTCYIPKRYRRPYVKEHTRFNKRPVIQPVRDPAKIAVFQRVPA